jgi:hypothetical protein
MQVFSPTRKYVFDIYSLFIAHQLLGTWIKPFLCVTSPYVHRSASSESGVLAFPETLSLLPFTGFVQP